MVPDAPYCPKCGYPLHYGKRKEEGNHDVDIVPETPLSARDESIHKINSIPKVKTPENVGTDSGQEEQSVIESAEEVHDESSSPSLLETEDFEWIRMLKRLRISAKEVREIEVEWIRLIKQIRELSRAHII